VHFVDEDSEGPPVDCLPVTLVEDDFRGDILRGAADGEGSAFCEELGEAEVSKFEVAVIAYQQILRLQVSEDDVFAVQVLKAAGNNGAIEACLVSGKRLHVSEVGEELPAVDEFKHQV